MTLNFTANLACPSGTSVPLGFTGASLTDANGPLPVSTDERPGPGDLPTAPAATATATASSTPATSRPSCSRPSTADLPWWLDAPQSDFPGSPVGCDANASKYIDVADVVCTVLVVFGNSSCTGGSLMRSGSRRQNRPRWQWRRR